LRIPLAGGLWSVLRDAPPMAPLLRTRACL
jgi:hypothetical protein